jgi:DNA-binding transcriptional regulator YiaG
MVSWDCYLAMTDTLTDALERSRLRRRLPEPAERRLLRERVGLSQGDIARALKVTRPTICRWESGSRDPGRQHLAAYIELLNRLTREVM